MTKRRKKTYNRRKRGRRKNQRRCLSLKNSVILMLVLLCIFFATRTDAWLAENIQSVLVYVEQSAGIYPELPEEGSLAGKLQAFLERVGTGRETAAHTEGEMEVHFLDVGQGNACLVESEGHYMLVDGGDRDASSFVVAYLRDQGVEKLDYIIASHYDADHISGLVGALNVYPTEKILCPDYETDTKIYASLMKKIEENGCEVVHPAAGESYTLGEAVFTIVAPAADDYEDDNNRSIGIRLVHGRSSFLMLGDAEKESEADICSSGECLQSDVYLVSHHGSSSSTTEELLARVRPSAAVISAGEDNAYGHPHSQTMERLKAAGVQLYRTDIQKTVIAVSDGEKLVWSQEPCMDFTPGDRQ